MTISHSTSARNSLADQIDTLVNGGSTDPQGDLVLIESAGPSDLVEFNLQDPAFGAASSGTITLQGSVEDLMKNKDVQRAYLGKGTREIWE